MNATNTKPRVALIGTGGTISSIAIDNLDVLDYPDASRKAQPAEIIARTPELARFADVVPINFREVGSTSIGPADWLELVQLIHQTAAQNGGFDGYVILHGTATLEETAYFLNLTLKIKSTVVLVGAQRPASAVSTDGPMNLIAAVRTAIDPLTRGLGVLVVLNDEIQAAREVTKVSTYRLNTFRTPDFGVLGQVDGDRVVIYRHPVRKHTVDTVFDVRALKTLPRVDIVNAYGGADDVAIEAFVAAGAQGLISAGLPPGIAPPLQNVAFERMCKKGVVVVQANRGGAGRVARRKYLRDKKIVASDNLNAQKCRILLMLALTLTQDPEVVQSYFDSY
jgi:L-asparaginase